MRPIAARLAAVDAIQTKAELIRTLAELSKIGVSGPLACYVDTDAKKSDQHILDIAQSGLGLPDRDYYWDAKFKTKLAAYQAYIERMLTLAKIGDAQAGGRRDRGPGNPDRQGPVVQGAEPRRRQDLQQDGPCRVGQAGPGLRLAALFPDDRREGRQGTRRRAAVLPHVDGRVARQSPAGDLEGLAEVQHRPSLREPAQQGIGGRGLRLLRHDAPRRSAKPPPLEAGRGRRGRLPGRGGGQAVRREAFPAGSQAADGSNGQERAGGLSGPLSEPGLDEPRDQAEGPGETGHVHAQDRLSEEVARLFGPGDPPRRPGGQRRARTRSTSGTATWPSSASRSIATSGT